MTGAAIVVDGLAKTFKKPFTGKKVEAVRGVSFEVTRGEIFGFLGPNGAGKTTTIKMLTGLIAPTRGKASIFGVPTPSPDAMARVGFLPENPYVYPYLTPREFVSMCGRLSGVGGKEHMARVEKVLARVGMSEAIDRPARNLSKGMLQRVGLAAALVHGPELLILDEPMSGLDPVGRKEVRDLILEERAAGRTVFFSTHILADVETLCDRVCILKKGEAVVSGRLDELLASGARRSEISLRDVTPEVRAEVAAMGHVVKDMGAAAFAIDVEGDEQVKALLQLALTRGARVESVTSKRESLEDLFVRRAL